MRLLFPKELISDMQSRAKFLPRAHLMSGAELVSRKPFAPKREQTDGNPNGIETCCCIGSQIKRVNHKQDARKDVHALI